MVEGAEQERQREHVGGGDQGADRCDVGAIEIDGADPRLLDGVLLLSQLARVEYANAVTAGGPLLDDARHELQGLDGGIVLRLGVGDAELARLGDR
jgi:hypothetical protein